MTAPTAVSLQRDRAEIARSRAEAQAFVFTGINHAQVERYLNPPSTAFHGLEYAYYLLGDVRGKTVLDLGCGKGENLIPLAVRGADVLGVDLSPDLVECARRRVRVAGLKADVRVGSAYSTGLPDGSVDVIFCIALIHHLEISRVRAEMLRVLRSDGFIVLLEPVRFSVAYDRCRKLLRPGRLISEYEHPLTRTELSTMLQGLRLGGMRYFRLPFVPLVDKLTGKTSHSARRLSCWMTRQLPALDYFATSVVVKLHKE